jgi:Rap1a immunity proteins
MKFIFGFLLLSLVAVSSRAQSNTSDGNYLLGSCQISVRNMDGIGDHSAGEAWRDGFCSGIVLGILYASPLVCQDPNVTLGQGIRVVDKYLRDHPEKLHLTGLQLAREALSQAFPCKR